jgi:2-succinyl-6-hydroxy-2,4-cyclohexadiene-1-carboxylate synthase
MKNCSPMPMLERLRLGHDGVAYAVERRGDGPPVLLLHGFTGSLRTWDDLAPALAADHHVIAVDLLGHGDSDAPREPSRYGLESAANDLTGLLDQWRIERCAVIGYSMGGRLALGFAVHHPDRAVALLLESATAGIADATERSARRASDDRLAGTIEQDGLESFVNTWERLPLFASQARLPRARRDAIRRERLRQRDIGLANSLRGFGQGVQPTLHSQLGAVGCPVLLVVGGDDAKFRAIAVDLAGRIFNARVEVVPEAGHAAHLEQPERFASLARTFLQSAGRPAGEGSR